MCKPASFIVTRHQALFSRVSDHHDIILFEHGLRDDSFTPQFVRVEITPPDLDFSRPFSAWKFKTDQDLLPDWYDPEEAEAACRRRLPLWVRHHLEILGQGVFGDGVTRDLIAYNGNLNLRGTSIRRLPDNLTVEGKLHLHYSKIEELPTNLTVGCDLNISHTGITEIPRGLTVGGNFYAFGVSVKRFLGPLKVCGRSPFCPPGSQIGERNEI